MLYYCRYKSPLGELLLTSNGIALTGLHMVGQKYFPTLLADWVETSQAEPFCQTIAQLNEYFQHQRQTFELPLNPSGTDFQKQVWQRLSTIPYGTTCTYGELAHQLGQPSASRAVGAANGRNPISIIVPCHRVIAGNGKLTGYAGGLNRKSWLLGHEGKGAHPHQKQLFDSTTL
jgi:methylated-DNA-[protein]-cysteine S-methyltransferase